jgi:plasmid stabilization system protein ParE
MVKAIIWNRRASNNFNSIIKYLQNKWGDKVTQNFVIRTYQ